jgi:arylsulfatase
MVQDPPLFSVDETMGIGQYAGFPVTDDYLGGIASRFTGAIEWVQVDLGDDDVSHLKEPEQTYNR